MDAKKNKPIKRSEFLIALSRDHHAGLLFCWKIKEGVRNNIPLPKILKYINYFWESHLKNHFLEEEVLLFNRLNHELCRQGKSEHLMIEERLRHLNDDEQIAYNYSSFAELLTEHIRFEERVLYPHLEATLPQHVLKQVSDYLMAEHQSAFVDNYPDEFWAKNYPSA